MKALIIEIATILFTAPLGLVNVPIKEEAGESEEKPYHHWKDIFYC